MKKVLFATTALVLSAGVAAAEVSLSGDGRMGVQYNGEDWNFSSRARVQFGLSGQTDNGLEFGGSFRVHEGNGARYGSAGTVFISGAFGQIELGDAVSAPEALFGDLPEVGFEDLTASNGDVSIAGDVVYSIDPETGAVVSKTGKSYVSGLNGQGLLENDIPYLTGDGGATTDNFNPILLYTYSSGPIALAASMSDGNKISGENAYATSADDAQEIAIAAAYTYDAYTFGGGFEVLDPAQGEKATQGTVAGTATFGNTDLKVYYAWGNQANDVDQAYGIGFSSSFGATTVMGYVQKVEFAETIVTSTGNLDDVTWWGLGASYDLGGGAALAGGISDADLDGSDVTADFGVKFKF